MVAKDPRRSDEAEAEADRERAAGLNFSPQS